MKKLISTALLLVATTNALAEWRLIGASSDANTYTDLSTIKKIGSKTRIWILTDLKGPEKVDGQNVLSSVFLHEIDCKEETWTQIKGTVYSESMGAGNVVFSSNFMGTAQSGPYFISPNSIASTELKVACHK